MGEVIPDDAHGELAAYQAADMPGGRAAVRRQDGVVVRLAWPELGGPMFHPATTGVIADGRVQVVYLVGRKGLAEESVDLRFDWQAAPGVRAVQPYIMHGQSLALNVGHDAPLTAGPVAPGRALMYDNAGPGAQMSVYERPRLDKHDFGPCHFPQSDLDRLVHLCEQRGESPVSAAVAGFLHGLPDDTAVVASNHARGGMAIMALMPKRLAGRRGSGIQYAGLLRAAVRTRQVCDAHGCAMRQPVVSFIQGESAEFDDGPLYGQRLLAMQGALTEDLGRITGLADPVRLVTDQTRVMLAPDTPLDAIATPVAVWQLRMALAHPGRITCVGPKYVLPRRSTLKGRGDRVHLRPEASRLLGDYHGRAIRQVLAGQPWLPLHVAEYRREGARIRLRVAGGDGSPLVIDTDLVRRTEASLYGFRWLQTGGQPRHLVAIEIAGREIVLDLDADPGVAGQDFAQAALTIGFHHDAPVIDEGPLTGGRTNIRDSCRDQGLADEPLHNWLCHDWFREGETSP